MNLWLSDPDLAYVRDQEWLDKLPEEEQPKWLKLWSDVRTLRDETTPAVEPQEQDGQRVESLLAVCGSQSKDASTLLVPADQQDRQHEEHSSSESSEIQPQAGTRTWCGLSQQGTLIGHDSTQKV
jgi:hypothetical protein